MERLTTIRSERAADAAALRRIDELAFGGELEAGLVEDLRASEAWIPELALVAEADDGAVVGHVVLSAVELAGGPALLSLAPVAVDPIHQDRGIGGALIRAAIDRARATSWPAIVLIGHATYYPRFGFEPAGPRGLRSRYEVPDDVWMVLPLPAYDAEAARGEVLYPAIYDGERA